MARKQLKLNTAREGWLCEDERPGDYPNRPLRAVLVGGNPSYGNVKKLPGLLWKEFGIVVVKHAHDAIDQGESYDLAINLTDQGGHTQMKLARAAADANINVPATWSKMVLALADIGIERFPGEYFNPPVVRKPKPAPTHCPAPPPLSLVPQEEEEVAEHIGLSKQVKDLVKQLKDEMEMSDIQRLELELDDNGELLVKYRKVVVVEDEETF